MTDDVQALSKLKPVMLGKRVDTGEPFHLSYPARRLGTYIVGLAGMGKTSALLNIVKQDIASGHGVCVIDPQGQWMEDILARIPKKREKDVIYIDPAEKDRPVGLHLFECADPDDNDLVDRVMAQVERGVFEEIWGDMVHMPRLAEVLRVACRTLIRCQSLPEEHLRPTLIELPWLFQDPQYRQFLLGHLRSRYATSEQEVLGWWDLEYEPKSDRDKRELTASTLNKVRAFSQSAMVKRVVGQSKSTVDFRRAMDEGRIVLVNLSEGKVEREVASLIGALVISRIHVAAKSRIDLLEQSAPMRRFHLVVDEFQNFATRAFATLQNECRQYGVDITIAHQNREGQLAGETEVQASTLGTTNWIAFRSNPLDASVLATGFATTPPEPETSGEREPLGYASNPWDTLKRKAHERGEVMELVHEIDRWLFIGDNPRNLLQDVEWTQEKLSTFRIADPEQVELNVWSFQDEAEREVFEKDLNRYLYIVMTSVERTAVDALLVDLGEKLFRYKVIRYYGDRIWKPAAEDLSLEGGDPPIGADRGKTSLQTIMREIWRIADEHELAVETEKRGIDRDAIADEIEAEVEASMHRALNPKRKGYHWEYSPTSDMIRNLDKWVESRRKWAYEKRELELSQTVARLQKELTELQLAYWRVALRGVLITEVEKLAELLQEHPVWVRGGQPVTDYENPRLHTDVAAERANQIRQLAQFEALCRIQDGRELVEGHIRTRNSHTAWPERSDNPTQKIKEASRQQFGRDIGEVEATLAARLNFYAKPQENVSADDYDYLES